MKEKNDKNENIFSFKPLPALNERVKKLIDFYAGGSVKKFSEMIKLSSSQKLNRIFNLDKRNGEYPEVSSDIILSIANMFSELNTEWLLIGKGEMLKKKELSNTIAEPSCIYSKGADDFLYKMCREKDVEIKELSEKVGEQKNKIETLKEEILNLKEEITLIRTSSHLSSNAEFVQDVHAKEK